MSRRMTYPCRVMTDKLPTADDPKLPTEPASEQAAKPTNVYAIQGADPEVLAYAMAKYSRSSLSMKESLAEISSQRAEQFLNTFYFQYGHRSIADLAHIPFAIERLSLLAAVVLVDEQRWDGQERSTRYQNFRKSGWYTPNSATSPVSVRQSIRPRSRPCLPPTSASARECWRRSRVLYRSPRR